MSGDRVRFDFERLDVFTVALDAVVIVDGVAEDLPEGRGTCATSCGALRTPSP